MKIKLLIIGLILVALVSAFLVFKKDNSARVKKETVSATISDDSLLTIVESSTFRYFSDGAEPVSGMARERIHMDGNYPENDMNVVTTGGSGFGVMALVVGINRGFIGREEGVEKIRHIVDFLKKADRFHGAWSHWIYGETGRVKPFGEKDNGGDIVETAYMAQGLLSARQYLRNGSEPEKRLAADIDTLWRQIEWNFFTRGQKVIYWHWSPNYGWIMNMPVTGYNECLILYVLAASSPTYPIDPEVYHSGWAGNGKIMSKNEVYGIPLILKFNYAEEYGGPLFWAHYSYLGLDPRGLSDKYADYWKLNVDQATINHKWCSLNPNKFMGYSDKRWGLSASYSVNGYAAHAPGEKNDLGVISPTAAVSSLPYTPAESMAAIKDFYFNLGSKIFGSYGFYDAFSEQNNWFPQRYLAIDQGPEIVMIENYRTALMWKLFMSCPEVQTGLKRLGFNIRDEKVK